MKKLAVDINCDLGESFGVYTLGQDEEILKLISSANVACGFHAGDPHVMRNTVSMAKRKGVYRTGIGQHLQGSCTRRSAFDIRAALISAN